MLAAALAVGYLAATGLFGALSRRGQRAAALGPGVFEKSLLLTLGLSIIMINAVQYFFTATPKMVQTSISAGAFSLGWLRITYAQVFAAGLAVAAFAALSVFLLRTNAGRALRAVSQSQDAALMIGLDPVPVARRAIAISILLSALAAVALAPIYVFQPTIGQSLLLKAFAIVIIGGMGNVPGAAVAALALGVLESLVGGLGDTVWQNAIAFLAMIAILIVRPSGLFSAPVRHG
jgi:branched-chain amino acid transport system permease protein